MRLAWTVSNGDTRITNDVVVIDTEHGAMAYAPVDLRPYANEAILISLRGVVQGVSCPPNPWNGVKVMLSYADAKTGVMHYPMALNGQTGTFGPETFHVFADFRNKDVAVGTLCLGLENVKGHVAFDLRTLQIEKVDKAEYAPHWKNLPPLRGFMLPHAHPPQEEDFATLSAWGAHLARFQMVRSVKNASEMDDLLAYDRWLDERMDWLEQALKLGRKYKILLIVDLHSTPGDGSGANGNGRVFEKRRLAEHYLDCWRKIATRFKGRKGIYAFDLANEPRNPNPKAEDCWNLQLKAAQAIRAIDPDVAISIECEWGDLPKPFEWLSPLPMSNTIYQVHMYAPFEFSHQRLSPLFSDAVEYPGAIGDEVWNKDRLRRELQPVRDFQLRYGARILVGEFSAAVWAKGADQWLTDVVSIMNEYGWDWTYHAFREAPCWSLEFEGSDWSSLKASEDNPRKKAVLDGLKCDFGK
ncbi:MAG: cellulase family glycosylhydrolase [bacterium]|nr:cellulase family glycosylhydrolase [Candidatus Colisoma equi]